MSVRILEAIFVKLKDGFENCYKHPQRFKTLVWTLISKYRVN